MKKCLLTITAVLISAVCVLSAQTVTQAWATLAFGAEPAAIAIDPSGNVYTANGNNNTVSKITPGGVVTDPWATLASGSLPYALAIDASGNVYTANENINTVSKITPDGVVTQTWTTLAPGASLSGIVIDASDNVYTVDFLNNTIGKVTPEGAVTQVWATLAPGAGPNAIAIDAAGNLYTANYLNSTVSKITPSGAVTQSWATLINNAIPRAIALDATGNVYTANTDNNTVSKITPDGTVTQSWATLAGDAGPIAIALDAAGNVYTANVNNNTVSKITADGTVTQAWAILASDASPNGIALDAAGNVYTANTDNNTVSKIRVEAHVVYVNASASGANDGTSWTDAFIYFQAGVNSASSGDSVFVAAGNYPLAAGYSYNMKEGVKIYGSFAGTETSLSQRNLAAGNISVLKGSDGRVIDNSSNNLTAAAVLDGFSITGGHADYGAGMYNYGSSPTIVDCSFWGNTAIGYGGGMENSSASPVLINCTFSGNSVTGGVGGGIYNYASNSIMTNCTFFGNTASGGGGGIYNSSSSPVLTNTIFWGNTAASGADILQSGGSFSINHSYTQTDFTASGGMGNITSGIDPFVNSSNPGGADGIYGTADDGLELANGSSAINTGSPDITGLNLPLTDIAGLPRTARNRIDIGAYEFNSAAIWYVTQTGAGTENGSSWSNASGTLQSMINGAFSGDSVFVAGGNYPLAAGYSYNMKEGVKIYGSFAGTETSLSQRSLAAGNSSVLKGSDGRVIDNSSNNLTAAAVLDGFSITGGYADSGAGMYNYGSSPTIVGCSFWGNTAIGYGGGMENSSASPVLINCTFSGNSVTGGVGGGIYNYASNSIMTNCTFFGNTASGGGGIYNSSSSPVLTNTIFWGNTAASGADILQSGGSFSINHSYTQTDFTASGGMGNITSGIDPFVNSSIPGGADGIYGTADDGLELANGSPAIDAGYNASLPAGDTLDLAGNQRIVNVTVDMGAYEYKGAALPVTIQNFTGIIKGGTATLKWQSGVESNFKGYQLEKSTDGNHFTKLATIAAIGSNSSYHFSTSQTATKAWYRLQLIGQTGVSRYYDQIVALQRGAVATSILVYPNPATNYIHIRVATGASISLYDAAGTLVRRQNLSAGVNQIDIRSLPAGIYYGLVNGQKVKFLKK